MIPTVSIDRVLDCIYMIRAQKVMRDNDLAELYNVELRALVQAVKRNADRFPPDFAFQLTQEEYRSLRSQIVILERPGRGRHRKYLPYFFSEQGVAMLSGILNSPRAVQVNIAIMRAFVRMRRMISGDHELAKKLRALEDKLIAHDYQIGDIVKAIRKLMFEPKKQNPKIGF